jgi:hypothetical protein
MTPVHQFERGVYISNSKGFDSTFTLISCTAGGFSPAGQTDGFIDAIMPMETTFHLAGYLVFEWTQRQYQYYIC